MNSNETALFYDAPTQVKYYDPDFNAYMIGIAVGPKLITVDGDYVDIDYIIAFAKKRNIAFDNAVMEMSWKALA